MSERGPHWASGGIPEDYKFNTSDYPKSRKTKSEGGFVPVEEIPDTNSLNPEEHLLMKEEEGLLDDSVREHHVWNELMDEEIDEEEEKVQGHKIQPDRYERMAEGLEEAVDVNTKEEKVATIKAKGEHMPRYYKQKKIKKGKEIVVRGRRPAQKPKDKKPDYKKTARQQKVA